MRPHRRESVIETEREERPHLLDGALLHHAVEARIDRRIKRLTLRRDDDPEEPLGMQHGSGIRALPLGERNRGRVDHFQRAQETLGIAGAKSCRHDGIARLQRTMQSLRADPLGFPAPMRANLRRHVGDLGKPLGERLEIEAGAADEDRQAPLDFRIAQCVRHVFEKTAYRVALAGGNRAVETMRGTLHLRLRRACGEDGKLAIDLHGIGIDDDAAEALGEVEGGRGFAARGRPGDEDGLRPTGVRRHDGLARRHGDEAKLALGV